MDADLVPRLGLHGATFVLCAVSSLVPLVNSEAYLLIVSATAPLGQVPGVVVAAALGQMAGKSVLYLAGRGVLRLPRRTGGHAWRRYLEARAGTASGVVLASAFAGVPPLYAVSVGAGALRWPFGRFLAVGTCGRLLRFGLLVSLPQILKEVWR